MFEALFDIVIAGFILVVLVMLNVRRSEKGMPLFLRMATDQPQDMSISKKISRQILILPIILSVGFPVGFMVPFTRVGYWLFGEDPAPVSDGVFFYAVSGMFAAFIPYWLMAYHAKRSITSWG